MRDEAFCRQGRHVIVSPGQAYPTHVQLPSQAGRDLLSTGIEDVSLQVRNGLANSDATPCLREVELLERGIACDFSRAIEVEQHRMGHGLTEAAGQICR